MSVIYWERLRLGPGNGDASVSLRLTSSLRPLPGDKALAECPAPSQPSRVSERRKPWAREAPGGAFSSEPGAAGARGMGPAWRGPSGWTELGEALQPGPGLLSG